MKYVISHIGITIMPVVASLFVIAFLHPEFSLDIFKHCVFVIFWLLIPATVFGWFFLKKTIKNPYAYLISGLPVGLFFILFFGWLIFRFHLPKELAFIPPIFSLGAIFVLLKNKKKILHLRFNPPKKLLITCFLLLAIILIQHIYLYTLAMPSPNSSGVLGAYYVDLMWNLGNTWAVIRGYPLIDPRGIDIPLTYHIGQSLFQAMSFWTMDANPIAVHLYIDPIIQLSLTVMVIFWGSILIAGESFLFAFLWLFCSYFTSFPANRFYLSLMHVHLLYHPLTYFFSIGYLSALIITFVHFFKSGNFSILYLILSYLALSIVKAPIVALLAPVLITTMIVLLIFTSSDQIQNVKKNLFLLISFMVITCISVMNIFYNDSGGRQVSSALDYLSAKPFNTEHLFNFLNKNYNFISFYYPYIPALPIILIFVIWLLSKWRTHIGEGVLIWLAISISFMLASIGINLFWDLTSGRVYPMWYAYFFTFPFLASSIQKMQRFKIVKLGSICFFAYFGYIFLTDSVVSKRTKESWYVAGRNQQIWDVKATIDVFEMEALDWLKNNAPGDAVLISDRRKILHGNGKVLQNTFFAYSAFSGKQSYIEGDAYIFGTPKNMAGSRWKEIETLYERGQISKEILALNQHRPVFIFLSKRFNKNTLSIYSCFKEVFSNQTVSIYRLDPDNCTPVVKT